MLLVESAFVGLWEESLFGKGVDWRGNVVGAVLPRQDHPCGRVVQANLIHVLVVLCKGQPVRKLLELEVRREVQLCEFGNALPEAWSQRWHVGLLLVLVKAGLDDNFAQLIIKLFPHLQFLCCRRFILYQRCILQFKVAAVEKLC